MQAYQQREEDAQTRYRGSPAVDEARRQMLERETDIARMQATQAYGVQADRNKTEADLRSSLAGHDAIASAVGGVSTSRLPRWMPTRCNCINWSETERSWKTIIAPCRRSLMNARRLSLSRPIVSPRCASFSPRRCRRCRSRRAG